MRNNNNGSIPLKIVRRFFPFVDWFEKYSLEHFRADFIAGLTVALVLIPQSMAYAQLAGLPAYYGLYAAFLPPLIAALFGSSRQLATGPVAVVSLMTATALEPLATAGSPGFIAYAILLAFMVGSFQFLLGILKLGLIVNFLSHPVVNGFTNAAALIIASSQLSKLFGVYIVKGEYHYETIYRIFESAIHYTHWPTFAMAVLAFTIMIVFKKLNPRYPNVLIAVIITIIISWLAGFENKTSVDLNQINCSLTRGMIINYNNAVDSIGIKSERKIALTNELEDRIEAYGEKSYQVLNLQYDISVLTLEISEMKEKSNKFRAKIRYQEFKTINKNGNPVFYNTNTLPEGKNPDDGIWRLKVGNDKIAISAITCISGGAVVGNIPKGLPSFEIPDFDFSIILALFPMAIIISLLGFMEAISIAKAMAAKTGQRLDANQELIGQGLANIIGCLGRSYAVSGSFSRSAVNIQAGAVTGLSNVISSAVVMITLFFFTSLLYHLPQSVLAAIIIMAVIGLINVTGFIHAWKAQKYDGIISIITFVCTLAFAPHLDIGIMIGVGLSLSLYLYRGMEPNIVMLSLHPDGTYRNRRRFNLKQCKHIAAIRYNGSLFFANVNYLEKKVLDVVSSMPELRHILLVGNGINELDASGENTLSNLVDRLRDSGHDISLCGLNDHVLDTMKRTYLYYKIGKDHIYRNVTKAIESIHKSAHEGTDEQHCPLKEVIHDKLGKGLV
ncbi:SulP family inorganic anion transporter [Bacteroidota bacterium]